MDRDHDVAHTLDGTSVQQCTSMRSDDYSWIIVRQQHIVSSISHTGPSSSFLPSVFNDLTAASSTCSCRHQQWNLADLVDHNNQVRLQPQQLRPVITPANITQALRLVPTPPQDIKYTLREVRGHSKVTAYGASRIKAGEKATVVA